MSEHCSALIFASLSEWTNRHPQAPLQQTPLACLQPAAPTPCTLMQLHQVPGQLPPTAWSGRCIRTVCHPRVTSCATRVSFNHESNSEQPRLTTNHVQDHERAEKGKVPPASRAPGPAGMVNLLTCCPALFEDRQYHESQAPRRLPQWVLPPSQAELTSANTAEASATKREIRATTPRLHFSPTSESSSPIRAPPAALTPQARIPLSSSHLQLELHVLSRPCRAFMSGSDSSGQGTWQWDRAPYVGLIKPLAASLRSVGPEPWDSCQMPIIWEKTSSGAG